MKGLDRWFTIYAHILHYNIHYLYNRTINRNFIDNPFGLLKDVRTLVNRKRQKIVCKYKSMNAYSEIKVYSPVHTHKSRSCIVWLKMTR